MTIRLGTCAVVLAVALAATACSQPRSDQAPTPAVTSTGAGPIVTSQPTTTVVEPSCGMPTLRVSSPADGSRVRAPFPITYEVRCFPVGREGTIYLAADGMVIDLHPKEPTGAVIVPDHPLLSGRRTLTIQLADVNGQLLANPEARVVISVTIEGSR